MRATLLSAAGVPIERSIGFLLEYRPTRGDRFLAEHDGRVYQGSQAIGFTIDLTVDEEEEDGE